MRKCWNIYKLVLIVSIALVMDNTCTECMTKPCLNGATCSVLQNHSRICHCLPRFSGSSCEIDLAPCESHPCPLGTVCIPHGNEYNCSCLDIRKCFHGSCADVICQNGGSCREFNGASICICPYFFKGKTCQYKSTHRELSTSQEYGDNSFVNCSSGKVINPFPSRNPSVIAVVTSFAVLLTLLLILLATIIKLVYNPRGTYHPVLKNHFVPLSPQESSKERGTLRNFSVRAIRKSTDECEFSSDGTSALTEHGRIQTEFEEINSQRSKETDKSDVYFLRPVNLQNDRESPGTLRRWRINPRKLDSLKKRRSCDES